MHGSTRLMVDRLCSSLSDHGLTYRRYDLVTADLGQLAMSLLDAATLVTQGTKEGVAPAVSPNTGRLYTVGALGTGPLEDASFDISDVANTALAALRRDGRTRLYLVDLASGRASALGTVADGRPLRGIAIEP